MILPRTSFDVLDRAGLGSESRQQAFHGLVSLAVSYDKQ